MEEIMSTNYSVEKLEQSLENGKCTIPKDVSDGEMEKEVRKNSRTIIRFIESVDDPRVDRRKIYPLTEILLCIFIGILYGAKSYYNIVKVCQNKISALRMFLPYENGIPSHDTINRIMQILDPKQLEYAFRLAMIHICGSLKNKQIAIDGKVIKNANHQDSKTKCIMVSAHVCDDNITIAQEKVKDKSNEITAVPEILNFINIRKTTITMDAMGLQRETVNLIVERGGDYVICLKGNQKSTYEDVKLLVSHVDHDDIYIENEKQSGKVITRRCRIFNKMDMMQEAYRWTKLRTVVCLEKSTYYKEKTRNETRYFLSSLNVDAREHNRIIRNHWRIENNLHRTLDVFFGEDESTKRRGNSAQNFSVLRKIAISCFNQYFPKNMTYFDKHISLLLDDKLLYDFIINF